MPGIDLRLLWQDTINNLTELLNLDVKLQEMDPKNTTQESLLKWLVKNLRQNLGMLNSRVLHKKVMVKTNEYKDRSEFFVFLNTISKSNEVGLRKLLQALNKYFNE
jgi:hypothetical protein